MASTAILIQAEQNLLRWQTRLREAKALHRRRVAEARSLYPDDQARQDAYTRKSQLDQQRYQQFMEQASEELASQLERAKKTGPRPQTPPPSGSLSWLKRLLGLLKK